MPATSMSDCFLKREVEGAFYFGDLSSGSSATILSILTLKLPPSLRARAVFDPLLRLIELEPLLAFFGETDIWRLRLLLLEQLCFVGDAGSFSSEVTMCVG